MMVFLTALIKIIAILMGVISIAALLVWAERRILGIWQDRYGPNRIGPFGMGQMVADVVKLFIKEDWIPSFADRFPFVLAPCIIMTVMLLGFAVVPMTPTLSVVDLNIGLLFFLAMSSLGVYSIMLGGYASNNKYSLLGGLRSAAQMVSYEVFMGLSVMGVVMLAGSFHLRDIVAAQENQWFIIPQFIGFIVFLIAGIAETHRLPFDLPEAEHELVAGFHTEYSGMKFGMFMVGEYVGVMLISSMIVILFFGGWHGPILPPFVWFMLKVSAFILFFILLRAAIPRPRYDQLMAFGWKVMLPLSLVNLVATGGIALALQD